jgi:hypothetical protein
MLLSADTAPLISQRQCNWNISITQTESPAPLEAWCNTRQANGMADAEVCCHIAHRQTPRRHHTGTATKGLQPQAPVQSATYSALLADGAAGGGVHMAAAGEQGAEAMPPARRPRMSIPSARAPHTLGQVGAPKPWSHSLHLHACSRAGCTAQQTHLCMRWGPANHQSMGVLPSCAAISPAAAPQPPRTGTLPSCRHLIRWTHCTSASNCTCMCTK